MPTFEENALSIDALLAHPLFWTREKAKEFLCDLSDVFKSKEKEKCVNERKKNEEVKTKLEGQFAKVVSKKYWTDELDEEPKTYFEKEYFGENNEKKHYHGVRLLSLLRSFRNVARHFHEIYSLDPTWYFETTDIIDINNDIVESKTLTNINHVKEKERGNIGTKQLAPINEKKITMREKLSPYFGESVDDSVEYWFHKFPQLLPICYVFEQEHKLLSKSDREKYYLENGNDNTNFSMERHSSLVGVFNELYLRTANDIQYDKLLRQYTVHPAGKLRIFKMHPSVLDTHESILIHYQSGKVIVQKRLITDRSSSSGKSPGDNNVICLNPLTRNCKSDYTGKSGCCACTNLWESGSVEFKSAKLPYNNHMIIFCDNLETGLRKAYWNNNNNNNPQQDAAQSVVIFAKDINHFGVARSVSAFQKHETSVRKQQKFYELPLGWDDLRQDHRDLLLHQKVRLQRNVEILDNLLLGPPESEAVLKDMDTDFLLHLIHAKDVGLPQVIRDFGSPTPGTVELNRKLKSKNNMSYDNPLTFTPIISNATSSREFRNGPDRIQLTKPRSYNMQDLQTLKAKVDKCKTEDDLISSAQKTSTHFIISGESLLGKSTLLKRLAKKLTAKFSRFSRQTIIARLKFSEIIMQLNLLNATQEESIISEVIAGAITSSPFCKKLVTPVISGEADYTIYLLLDGLEEVEPPLRDKCIGVLKWVRENLKHVRVYVTTRKEHTAKIETALDTLAFILEPVDYENQCRFLTLYWLQRVYTSATEEELKVHEHFLSNFAKECIDKENPNLFESPFYLKILAEVYINHNSMSSNRFDGKKFTSLTELCNEFTKLNMTTVYSKGYQTEVERDVKSLSVLYTKENQEMLVIDDSLIKKTIPPPPVDDLHQLAGDPEVPFPRPGNHPASTVPDNGGVRLDADGQMEDHNNSNGYHVTFQFTIQ